MSFGKDDIYFPVFILGEVIFGPHHGQNFSRGGPGHNGGPVAHLLLTKFGYLGGHGLLRKFLQGQVQGGGYS